LKILRKQTGERVDLDLKDVFHAYSVEPGFFTMMHYGFPDQLEKNVKCGTGHSTGFEVKSGACNSKTLKRRYPWLTRNMSRIAEMQKQTAHQRR
jgi:hypothetical protein